MLYLIGPDRLAPQAIGLAPDPKETLARFQAKAPAPLKLHAKKELEKGIDQLALRIASHELRGSALTGNWYGVDETRGRTVFTKAVRAATGLARLPDRPNYAGLMTHLRTAVFGASQTVFGQVAGGASASLVSRWETGELEPGLFELHCVREFATRNGLPWDDAWMFRPPLPSAA